MKNARLVVPSEEYLQSYLEACREFKKSGTELFGSHDPDAFDAWKDTLFPKFEQNRLGTGLPEGYVPCSAFWLVEEGAFVGLGSIRHRLTPALERFGGHIGYAIRPSRWNMGYGTLQLGLLLEEAAKLGIADALVTCDDDNVGSYRVIEKNGGVYQDTIENTIGGQFRKTRRYWIHTSHGFKSGAKASGSSSARV